MKAHGKRHLGSYFRVRFHGADFGGEESTAEWIYREPRLTSLAEACERQLEAARRVLGHDRVDICAEEADGSGCAVQLTHVKPYREPTAHSTGDEDDDPMEYRLHTNISTFLYEERMVDAAAEESTPEQARLAVKRIVLNTERGFPDTRRRQRVVGRTERVMSPLELACDSLLAKAHQIRKILGAAGIKRAAYGFDKPSLKRLDLKHLQLFLQGAVSPTVNAGVLSYASAFTSPVQMERYGSDGAGKLVNAFRTLVVELELALRVNEAAIGSERAEYKTMLRNSFDGMLERLNGFFPGERVRVLFGGGA